MTASKDGEMMEMDGPSEENGHPPRADQSDPPDVTKKLLDSQNSQEMNGSVNSGVEKASILLMHHSSCSSEIYIVYLLAAGWVAGRSFGLVVTFSARTDLVTTCLYRI
ncbi:hypothetical protein GDO78_020551 [Eleutherodactylus coqui]|uniref:Uncharacterized protein n=1 Tax=Eleutherodactylus coqui TaxID=57060 RepID=A0A8J6BBD4_ELECQ|nr:hypothetical protein GDO78_020551 [Eleutherodactylus coqui]